MSRIPFLRHALEDKSFLVGSLLFCFLLIIAITCRLIAPYDPNAIATANRLQKPSTQHLWGTDHLGRDIFSRDLIGSQLSMLVGVSVAMTASVFGGLIGLLAGYFTWLDHILMRIMDGVLAFPPILLAIVIAGAWGPRVTNVIIAISVVMIPRMARIVRSSVLETREETFIEAARAIGAGSMRIMFSHILPNCLYSLIVQATYTFAVAILVESSLSFLGVGLPPQVPSWGAILAESRQFMRTLPWMPLLPGMSIMLAVLGVNFVGDGLRDISDPRFIGKAAKTG